MKPIDWNQWRLDYDKMSYRDNVLFYDEVYRQHPIQQHATKNLVEEFFRGIDGESLLEVLEVGGWDGELAVEMLSRPLRIGLWTNIEICRGAVLNSKEHILFSNIHPNKWVWDLLMPYWSSCNVFVCSHCIEHMKQHQLQMLVASLTKFKHCYIESPLPPTENVNWSGYRGSHILEVGWPGVDRIFKDAGFDVSELAPHVHVYTK